ncbi:TRAP transporter substrate-binding protein [Celeribacter indicus]|uniref:Exported protein (TRAP-type transport system, periplasmic component) n=1 Tax=Celeribacter indicus TaxID=1208324 RepID=A0A0B5E3C3_9RHOB|nr:TRAP transporter substrate-binding protein [Celeribacter indicus]AJE47546.1 exported protein (TRAP-type transport system, periplasmic component) [Celeribacter indicus]SDW09807.1 TRAP-type C4-dicarboxylate transport system, substrate-binding protein [Celeribacter indicus]
MNRHSLPALFATAILATAAAPTHAQDLTETRLNVIGSASFMPLYSEQEYPFWTETLPAASDGKIAAEVRPFNEAGLTGTELLRLLQQGVADAATPILGYLAADDAVAEAVDLAGIAPDAATARAVSAAWAPVLDAHFRETNGARVLGILAYPSQVLLCKNSFESLSDLQGRKVRTGNRSLAELVESLGASSVTMPIGDVVPSLERGVVDCAITGTLTAYNQGWYEVVSYASDLGLGWSQLATIVGQQSWDRMSEANQAFIETQYAEFAEQVWDEVDVQTEVGFDCLTGRAECPLGEPANMTLVEATDADRELLREKLSDTVVPAWVARCGEGCAENWNEAMADIVGVRAE